MNEKKNRINKKCCKTCTEKYHTLKEEIKEIIRNEISDLKNEIVKILKEHTLGSNKACEDKYSNNEYSKNEFSNNKCSEDKYSNNEYLNNEFSDDNCIKHNDHFKLDIYDLRDNQSAVTDKYIYKDLKRNDHNKININDDNEKNNNDRNNVEITYSYRNDIIDDEKINISDYEIDDDEEYKNPEFVSQFENNDIKIDDISDFFPQPEIIKTKEKKNDGCTFKYKNDRNDLIANYEVHDCKCCKDYFGIENEERIKSIGRHKSNFKRPDTPPAYWDVDF
ncbi:hypothetical protein DMUE_0102 [Dictyocoela muelleri]|nr:hypothetical protein DMUE_0102 [Dictyocoela muelleri]